MAPRIPKRPLTNRRRSAARLRGRPSRRPSSAAPRRQGRSYYLGIRAWFGSSLWQIEVSVSKDDA